MSLIRASACPIARLPLSTFAPRTYQLPYSLSLWKDRLKALCRSYRLRLATYCAEVATTREALTPAGISQIGRVFRQAQRQIMVYFRVCCVRYVGSSMRIAALFAPRVGTGDHVDGSRKPGITVV